MQENMKNIPTFNREVLNPKAVLGFGHDDRGIFAILNDGTVLYDLEGVTDNGDGTVNVRSVHKCVNVSLVRD